MHSGYVIEILTGQVFIWVLERESCTSFRSSWNLEQCMDVKGASEAASDLSYGTKRRPPSAGTVGDVGCTPGAGDRPVSEASVRSSLDWLDFDRERAVAARCGCNPMPARARSCARARQAALQLCLQPFRPKWKSSVCLIQSARCKCAYFILSQEARTRRACAAGATGNCGVRRRP